MPRKQTWQGREDSGATEQDSLRSSDESAIDLSSFGRHDSTFPHPDVASREEDEEEEDEEEEQVVELDKRSNESSQKSSSKENISESSSLDLGSSSRSKTTKPGVTGGNCSSFSIFASSMWCVCTRG